jgi:hypothetical protein
VAHTLDVDAMLSRMTHEQFEEWCAKDIVEPIGHSGTHDILARIGMLVASFMGQEDANESMFKWWEKHKDEAADVDTVFSTLEATVGAVRT